MGLEMGDIKFRIWKVKSEQIVKVDYSDNLELVYDGKYWILKDYTCVFWDDDLPEATDGIKLMQYTGMKDINGSEIYEEDIVKYGEDMYTIKYGRFIDMDVPTPITQIGFYLLDKKYQETFPLYAVEYKILGNIYENKDLLEDLT